MGPSHLRLYCGPEDDAANVAVAEHYNHQKVTVPLVDLMPLLADAYQSERTWLRDFQDDEITVSNDLYEVLLAYRHFRRPSA